MAPFFSPQRHFVRISRGNTVFFMEAGEISDLIPRVRVGLVDDERYHGWFKSRDGLGFPGPEPCGSV